MTSDPAALLCGVGVQYGTFAALTGVDLRIDPGERVALVGSSGAGKSTLLSLLAGLVSATTGSVAVLGSDLSTLSGRRLRRHRRRVGIVPQQLQLTGSLKVLHNVNAGQLGQWSTPAALASLVRPVGQDQVREALRSVGMEPWLHSRTEELSGGEQQRVAVARVMRQEPELILADEPVSAVDPALSETVLGCLCRANTERRATVVVSLHEPDLARRFATRVIGLRHGEVVFDLAPEQLGPPELDELYKRIER